ncbi:MAG: SPFH domain-containing protein [Caldilineaceae bacterium]
MDFLLLLLAVLVVVVILYLLTQSKVRIVPEEERLVVYRLGRFHKIAGPGPVILQRNLDEVKRTFSVRDEPHTVRVNGLFINGVPFGYTLNFWYRFDLKAAAGEERARLVNLAQFSDDERKQQVATKVREALVSSAAHLERGYKPAGNHFFYKLLPIIPGLPEFEALFAEVRQHLRTTLPLVGAILNEAHPITVTNIHLGNDIVNSFSRGRIATLLKETFPDLSPDLLLQAVSSIEGIDMPQQRVVFEGTEQSNARMDFQVDEESTAARVRVRPTPQRANPQAQPVAAPATTATPAAEQLTKDDLTILKRVPA